MSPPPEPPFRRVLVANRGEIVVRVARTCRAMGVETAGVFTPSDEGAVHLLSCDVARPVGSYVDAEALVEAALDARCDAIHPGYGFLSENAAFARAVRAAGLAFIGPPADAMAVMGSKVAARDAMSRAGVAVVPGSAPAPPDALGEDAARLGFPVLVKAAGGGGGKAMARVDRAEDLTRAARACSEEGARSFGDAAVYLEKLLERPRHVEIQVFGDGHGTIVALGERECSIQRRHQKVVEESPSPGLGGDVRRRMEEAAVAAARAVKYEGAGTVEMLLDGADFYFLEMNTRLQVEHPVTEWVTGLDLVRLQLDVAAGRPLPPEALQAARHGHAIECRVYAEDPAVGHLPQAGRLLAVREPAGPGVRVDSALADGQQVGIEFDPLLAKVSTHGATREEAILRMREALSRFVLLGVRTNVDFLQDVVAHPAFAAGDLSTRFLDDHFASWRRTEAPDAALAAAALPAASQREARGTTGADPWKALGAFVPGGAR